MNLQLSNNEIIVHAVLEKSSKPLKAYSILFEIQKKVHKIKSKNSYIACKNEKCINKSSTTFLICNLCEKITEIEEETISKHFSSICNQLSSKYSNHSLEIFGTCVSCNKNS